ncbi:unnamed protein product [Closterium sp. Naga37s-1]|nr:unnamed protein product [Closterium sp. Naga37s-1]
MVDTKLSADAGSQGDKGRGKGRGEKALNEKAQARKRAKLERLKKKLAQRKAAKRGSGSEEAGEAAGGRAAVENGRGGDEREGKRRRMVKHPMRVAGQRPGEQCFSCGAANHAAKDCPKRKERKVSKVSTTRRCVSLHLALAFCSVLHLALAFCSLLHGVRRPTFFDPSLTWLASVPPLSPRPSARRCPTRPASSAASGATWSASARELHRHPHPLCRTRQAPLASRERGLRHSREKVVSKTTRVRWAQRGWEWASATTAAPRVIACTTARCHEPTAEQHMQCALCASRRAI